MPDVTLPYPNFVAGTTIDSEQVDANNAAIVAALNDLDADNFSAALAALLGLSQSGSVRRGKSIISTEESRTNTAYGTLTTPDRVQSLVVPTDGLVVVSFQAMWKESSSGTARASLFIGADQLKVFKPGFAAPTTSAAAFDPASTADRYSTLVSFPLGLLGSWTDTAYTGDVTTGQAVAIATAAQAGAGLAGAAELGGTVFDMEGGGGLCVIDNLPAGTYTVSVQFKSSSGSVTAKNRRLKAWVVGF